MNQNLAKRYISLVHLDKVRVIQQNDSKNKPNVSYKIDISSSIITVAISNTFQFWLISWRNEIHTPTQDCETHQTFLATTNDLHVSKYYIHSWQTRIVPLLIKTTYVVAISQSGTNKYMKCV